MGVLREDYEGGENWAIWMEFVSGYNVGAQGSRSVPGLLQGFSQNSKMSNYLLPGRAAILKRVFTECK